MTPTAPELTERGPALDPKPLRPEWFYWIWRANLNGPAQWEPAQYLHATTQDRRVEERWFFLGTPYWLVMGNEYREREITTVGASNQWTIGPRIEPPEPLTKPKIRRKRAKLG